jgi:hypothetical protein
MSFSASWRRFRQGRSTLKPARPETQEIETLLDFCLRGNDAGSIIEKDISDGQKKSRREFTTPAGFISRNAERYLLFSKQFFHSGDGFRSLIQRVFDDFIQFLSRHRVEIKLTLVQLRQELLIFYRRVKSIA